MLEIIRFLFGAAVLAWIAAAVAHHLFGFELATAWAIGLTVAVLAALEAAIPGAIGFLLTFLLKLAFLWTPGLAFRLVRRAWTALRDRRRERRVREAFPAGMAALAAEVSRAGGGATRRKIQTLLRRIPLPPEGREALRAAFKEAQAGGDGHEEHARRLGRAIGGWRKKAEEAVDILYDVAFSDGRLHPDADEAIVRIAGILGISGSAAERIRARHEPAPPPPLREGDLARDYETLGVRPGISDRELRRVYLLLVQRLHPDRLSGTGAPRERLEKANRRLAEVNLAHERIVRVRRMRRERGADAPRE